MTLQQFHSLKLWHRQHARHPVERQAWDCVLTLWMAAWPGLPAALMIDLPWLEAAALLTALFLPGGYVALRRHLHRTGRLRCDWISAIG